MANRIGIGVMCTAMTRNPAREGFEIVGFNVAARVEIALASDRAWFQIFLCPFALAEQVNAA